MLDLILFVLAAAMSSDDGAQTEMAAVDSEPVVIEETNLAEEEPMVVEEDTMANEDEPMVAEETTSDGGSWNIAPADGDSWISNKSDDDDSWITNKPADDAEAGTSDGGGLLAGVVDDSAATSLGSAENFTAEPQIPSGKFTTATEVKPILGATKGNWVAVREYDGQDLLYVTHIWAWRCGLHQMRYAINGGEMQVWPLPPCHENTNAPNAIIDTDGLPYDTFPLGSIKSIRVELLLDDMSEDSADYVRTDVLMP